MLQQLHSNHMGIEKIKLQVHELVYWLNMNADIENTFKQCVICLDYQQNNHMEKIVHELPCKPRKVVGDDIFSINNNTILCILDLLQHVPGYKEG